jgi:hypothetical protein
MAKRILLAGVVGGVALFMWGGLAHMVLGLGSIGIKDLPQQSVLDSLRTSVTESGFYMFPKVDSSGKPLPGLAGGPNGILIYHATGAGAPMTSQLINECALNIVMALCAAFLLSLAPGLNGYGARVGFVTFLGLMVGLMTHAQYWNWYGFPLNYTLSYIGVDIVGFLIVGLVAAQFVKPASAQAAVVQARAA